MNVTHLVVHHSLSPDGPTLSWPEIRNWHTLPPPMGHGWQAIGYHCGLELYSHGYEVLIGRPWTMPGAHAPGHNHDSLGICLVGNFDQAPPTLVLWQKALDLVRWLQMLFHVPRENVLGHREATEHRSCPGKFFDVERFRAEL